MEDQHYPCAHVVPIEQEPRHHLVIENELVRAFAVEIAPHDRTLCHHHPHDYLLYVAGDGEIISAARDEEPKQFSYRDGECELSPAGLVHVVENLGDTAFRNVVVEFLPKASSLRRGPEPVAKWAAAGDPVWGESMSDPTEAHIAYAVHVASEDPSNFASIRQRFEDVGRAAVYTISLGRKVEVAVTGPVIVASPYGSGLNWKGFGGDPIILHNSNDLEWIPPGVVGILGGSAEGVVVFQLGFSDEELLAVCSRHEPLKSSSRPRRRKRIMPVSRSAARHLN